jgi:hypothetical protein
MIPHDVAIDVVRLQAALRFDETRPGRFGYFQATDASFPSALQAPCAHIPTPFYVVIEASGQAGKNLTSRVVSISELEICFIDD